MSDISDQSNLEVKMSKRECELNISPDISNILESKNFEISASKYRVGSKFQCSSSFKSQYSDFIHLPLPVKDRRVAIFLLVRWGRAQ